MFYLFPSEIIVISEVIFVGIFMTKETPSSFGTKYIGPLIPYISCCRQIKQLSRFGWLVVALLNLLMVLFAGLGLGLPWYELDYYRDCSGYYLAVQLLYGVCELSEPVTGRSRNCIGWWDENKWSEVL